MNGEFIDQIRRVLGAINASITTLCLKVQLFCCVLGAIVRNKLGESAPMSLTIPKFGPTLHLPYLTTEVNSLHQVKCLAIERSQIMVFCCSLSAQQDYLNPIVYPFSLRKLNF